MKPVNENVKKEKKVSYSDKNITNKQAISILKEIKQKNGDVVLVFIDKRTCIELSASLSQSERDERVANYIKVHSPIV